MNREGNGLRNLASDGGLARLPGTRYDLNKPPGLLGPLQQGVKDRSSEHFSPLYNLLNTLSNFTQNPE
jgi:hypothetical protein